MNFDEMTAFVGANGSGKTSVLMGLVRMFGTSAQLRTLTKDDFHQSDLAKKEETQLELSLEARFELPELLDDAEASASAAIPECLRHIVADDSTQIPVCRIRLHATWVQSASIDGEIESEIAWVNSLEDEPPDDSIHKLRGVERSLIQVIYVPAARDAVRELRAVSGTILSRVLRQIEWPEPTQKRLIEKGAEMAQELRDVESFSALEKSLQDHWTDLRGKGVGRPELSVAETDLTTLLRRIDPRVTRSSSRGRSLALLSEGERSLMYFALVASSLKFESEYLRHNESATGSVIPVLTLLAVEEPENHLAPQYLSRILQTLRKIKEHRTAQVVITSHSASILRRVEPSEIRHFRVNQTDHVTVKALTLPEDTAHEFKYVREAVRAHPELYFARAVVLGEGPSEEVVLPRVAAAMGLDIDPQFVAVVPLGGRHVHHFWRLLRDLGTPFVTLLDLDMGRADAGWARIAGIAGELVSFGEDSQEIFEGECPDEMSKWAPVSADDGLLQDWLLWLEENHRVYFSTPLDLDLAMLATFHEQYTLLRGSQRGPQKFPTENVARKTHVKNLVRVVLGAGGADGSTYEETDLENFGWYSYLFSSGSKPVSHALALVEIEPEDLCDNCPPVLSRLVDEVKRLAR